MHAKRTAVARALGVDHFEVHWRDLKKMLREEHTIVKEEAILKALEGVTSESSFF